MMKLKFDDFCKASEIAFQKKKIDAAVLIIWYHQKVSNRNSISINEINNYFKQAHLPEYNKFRLSEHLRLDKRITKGVMECKRVCFCAVCRYLSKFFPNFYIYFIVFT